jgi:hypothetical protein
LLASRVRAKGARPSTLRAPFGQGPPATACDQRSEDGTLNATDAR